MTRHATFPALFATVLAMGGCTTVDAPQRQHRTVLLTFDAASDAHLDRMIAAGELHTTGFFAQSRRRGYAAEQLTPINIANTGPSHAAIFSGAAPAVSGVVGQTFALPGDKLPKGSNAFSYVSDAETVIAAARRQGKRVACVEAPGFDGRTANYECDYMLSFLDSDEESVSIRFSAAAPGQSEAGAVALAPRNEAVKLPAALTDGQIRFWLTDGNTSDDVRFDTVAIVMQDGTTATLTPGRIFPLQRQENGVLTTNALWLTSLDPETGSVEIYWGQPFKTIANPAMKIAVIDKIGGWRGTLDARGLHAGRISEAGFDALNEYQARYAIDALALLLDQKDWELYVGYLPYLDTVQHEYLVTSPLQIDYATKSNRYADKVKAAYRNLDGWMGEILGLPGAANTNFIVASDHGMVATHSVLAISSLVESWGYSVFGDRPDIGIFTSGAAAHIYVNGDDRPGGHIEQARKSAIVADLRLRFSKLDDAQGNAVFAVVETNAGIGSLDLRHDANAGDLFVSANPGFGLETRKPPTSRIIFPISFDRALLSAGGLDASEVDFIVGGFFNRSSPGIHGHLADTPGIPGILYGVGPDIAKGAGDAADMLQITPTIACLLAIAPPSTAAAKPINGICERPQ